MPPPAERITRMTAVALLLAAVEIGQGQAKEQIDMVNCISGIGGIPVQNEWGGTKPISYLGHALRTLGSDVSDETLAAVGGEAFQFTYVDQPIDEPQRDHWPNDIFTDAAIAWGYELKWVLNADIASVKQTVQEEIRAGRPVITHSLDFRQHHGFHLIAGYDYTRDAFLLCPHGDNHPLVAAPIPRDWHGAVPGPKFWANNPLGLLHKRQQQMSSRQMLAAALSQAATLWELDTFPFGPFPWDAGDHFDKRLDLAGLRAPSGRAAFARVSHDILEAQTISPRMIWRLDAQFERYGYNRRDAARFLRQSDTSLPTEVRKRLTKAASLYETNGVLAAQLMESFWNHSFYALAPSTAAELHQVLTRAPALVFGGIEHLPKALPAGLTIGKVEPSVWGKVIVLDEPARRQHAAAIVRQMTANEEEAIRLLQATLPALKAAE